MYNVNICIYISISDREQKCVQLDFLSLSLWIFRNTDNFKIFYWSIHFTSRKPRETILTADSSSFSTLMRLTELSSSYVCMCLSLSTFQSSIILSKLSDSCNRCSTFLTWKSKWKDKALFVMETWHYLCSTFTSHIFTCRAFVRHKKYDWFGVLSEEKFQEIKTHRLLTVYLVKCLEVKAHVSRSHSWT